jgi:Ca-activated chloride channel family protein
VVEFQPKSTSPFSTNLTITSNDPKSPTFNLPLSGSQENISTLNVRINQVEIDCPSRIVTAYVSVTDQGGYPVTVLGINDFSVTETGTGGYSGPPESVPFVENTISISTAIVMDYSRSVGSAAIADMVMGTSMFIDQMSLEDEAEIIKFSQIFEVVQPFTSDINLLLDKVDDPWDGGVGSIIFDTVMQAVDDTAARSNARKAVILISDGWDFSTSFSLDNVINNALFNNVPIFTIGSGSNIDLGKGNLTRMADETGGQYYDASTSDNLKTIHQQLADVLFSHQYILTYISGLGGSVNADLTIGATLPSTAITGNHTKGITACQ